MHQSKEVINHLLQALCALGERDERGAALAEYVMLAGFIAIVVMIGVTALGQAVEPLFHSVNPTL